MTRSCLRSCSDWIVRHKCLQNKNRKFSLLPESNPLEAIPLEWWKIGKQNTIDWLNEIFTFSWFQFSAREKSVGCSRPQCEGGRSPRGGPWRSDCPCWSPHCSLGVRGQSCLYIVTTLPLLSRAVRRLSILLPIFSVNSFNWSANMRNVRLRPDLVMGLESLISTCFYYSVLRLFIYLGIVGVRATPCLFIVSATIL